MRSNAKMFQQAYYVARIFLKALAPCGIKNDKNIYTRNVIKGPEISSGINSIDLYTQNLFLSIQRIIPAIKSTMVLTGVNAHIAL